MINYILGVGQAQLLRKQISHELQFSCHLDSNLLEHSLSNLNKALVRLWWLFVVVVFLSSCVVLGLLGLLGVLVFTTLFVFVCSVLIKYLYTIYYQSYLFFFKSQNTGT